MTAAIPFGTAVLAVVGDAVGDSARDVRAKAAALLDFPHVRHLVVDLRGAAVLELSLLDDIARLARAAGKAVEVRDPLVPRDQVR